VRDRHLSAANPQRVAQIAFQHHHLCDSLGRLRHAVRSVHRHRMHCNHSCTSRRLSRHHCLVRNRRFHSRFRRWRKQGAHFALTPHALCMPLLRDSRAHCAADTRGTRRVSVGVNARAAQHRHAAYRGAHFRASWPVSSCGWRYALHRLVHSLSPP